MFRGDPKPVNTIAYSLVKLSVDTGKEKLVKEVAEQRWDRIKIVCTQPFNKV